MSLHQQVIPALQVLGSTEIYVGISIENKSAPVLEHQHPWRKRESPEHSSEDMASNAAGLLELRPPWVGSTGSALDLLSSC